MSIEARHILAAIARTPRPARARLKSLVTDTVFGIGLYCCAVGLRP